MRFPVFRVKFDGIAIIQNRIIFLALGGEGHSQIIHCLERIWFMPRIACWKCSIASSGCP